jgi:hypothetical protein
MDLVILCYALISAIDQIFVSSEFSFIVCILSLERNVAELVSLEILSSIRSWKTVLGKFSTFSSVSRRKDSVVHITNTLRSGLPGL